MEKDTENQKTPERATNIERMEKGDKALAALSMGAIWLVYKQLRNSISGSVLPGVELKQEDEERVKKEGWLKTALGKATDVYKIIGKVEDAIVDNKWDELMDEFSKKEKRT